MNADPSPLPKVSKRDLRDLAKGAAGALVGGALGFPLPFLVWRLEGAVFDPNIGVQERQLLVAVNVIACAIAGFVIGHRAGRYEPRGVGAPYWVRLGGKEAVEDWIRWQRAVRLAVPRGPFARSRTARSAGAFGAALAIVATCVYGTMGHRTDTRHAEWEWGLPNLLAWLAGPLVLVPVAMIAFTVAGYAVSGLLRGAEKPPDEPH